MFGWINVFEAVIVVLMLIPNIIYALAHKGEKNKCTNQLMNVIEQVGRYACIVLMCLPLLVGEFGFYSKFELLLYPFGNGCLLAAYSIVFAFYLKRKTRAGALALAVIPTCIFLQNGVLLRHWLLVGFAVLFGIGHIYVTLKNADE